MMRIPPASDVHEPAAARGMARMPQGILASGPRIMNAAMQQQAPVRMQSGGMVPTETFRAQRMCLLFSRVM